MDQWAVDFFCRDRDMDSLKGCLTVEGSPHAGRPSCGSSTVPSGELGLGNPKGILMPRPTAL